jgi:hypothetical protein
MSDIEPAAARMDAEMARPLAAAGNSGYASQGAILPIDSETEHTPLADAAVDGIEPTAVR